MQPKINLLKKIEFQILKNLGYTPSDAQKVAMAQSILNAVIGPTDSFLDSEMPATMFGATLDWSAGGANDSIVSITIGGVTVTQDLDNPVNTPIGGDSIPPAEVTDLSAVATSDQITLSWTDPVDADFNTVTINYGIGNTNTVFNGTINSAGTDITGLTGESEYTFLVKTKDNVGNASSGTQIVKSTTNPNLQILTGTGMGSSDWFGQTSSIDGDYMVVGARGDDDNGSNAGSVFIYRNTDGANSWGEEQKIYGSDNQAGADFGTSVDISGDYMIVGAKYQETTPGSGIRTGGAYIYRRTGLNTWGEEFRLDPNDPLLNSNDYFGESVSIDGDFAVVGAGQAVDAVNISGSGSVYVYQRTGTNTWSSPFQIDSSDNTANDWFGQSVSISGDYIVAGSRGQDTTADFSGAAYVYRRTSANIWGEEFKIKASDAAIHDYFGSVVSIDGDYLVANAPSNESYGKANAIYVYRRTATNTWGEEVKIVPASSTPSDYFASKVDIKGDYIIANNMGENSNNGVVYLYHRTGLNTWDSGTQYSDDSQPEDYYGAYVSISDNHMMMANTNTPTNLNIRKFK